MGISHTQEEWGESPMESRREYLSFFWFPSSVLPLAPSLFLAVLFRQTHSVANLSPKPQPWEIPNGFCQQGQHPPSPASPPLLPQAHACWAQDQAWGQWQGWECATHRAGGYNVSFYLAPVEARGRENHQRTVSPASLPPSAPDELFSLGLSSGWEAGEWQWLANCQLGSTPPIFTFLCSMGSTQWCCNRHFPLKTPKGWRMEGLGDSPVPFISSHSNTMVLAAYHIRLTPFPSFCHAWDATLRPCEVLGSNTDGFQFL